MMSIYYGTQNLSMLHCLLLLRDQVILKSASGIGLTEGEAELDDSTGWEHLLFDPLRRLRTADETKDTSTVNGVICH